MTKEEVIEELIAQDLIVLMSGQFIFTKKYHLLTNQGLALIKTDSVAVLDKPHPALSSADNKKDIWNQFIADTEIPHRVNTGSGTYTVRQFSKSAVNKLIQIMSDPSVDYKTLVDSTKHYYKTVTYKILLSRYLLEDVWQDEYNEYVKKKLPGATDAPWKNKFENQ